MNNPTNPNGGLPGGLAKRPALGRGLSALIPQKPGQPELFGGK